MGISGRGSMPRPPTSFPDVTARLRRAPTPNPSLAGRGETLSSPAPPKSLRPPTMILVIDNYDSFTFNLVHYLIELGADVRVERNDALTATVEGTCGASGMPYTSWRIGKMLESYEKPASCRMSSAHSERLVIE